jgi:hypothetical protein
MATTLTKAFADLIAPSFNNLNIALIRQDGSECTGGGYQRMSIGQVRTYDDTNYIYISNTSQITFALATSDIAPLNNLVSQVKLYKDNDLLATIDLAEAKPYLNQDQFLIAPDSLVLRIPKTNNG